MQSWYLLKNTGFSSGDSLNSPTIQLKKISHNTAKTEPKPLPSTG